MKRLFHYSICTLTDKQLFVKQCAALEKHIPGLVKGKLLHDVDDSLVQLYRKDGKELRVYNSEHVGAIYIESEFDLRTYFPNAQTGYA